MSILIVGSVAFDTVETPFGRAENVLGGAAVYSSVAASFFHPVSMVAVVGEDFGQEHVEFLNSRGIDTCGLVTAPGLTFRWCGRYLSNMSDRETLETKLNVFENFEPVLPLQFRKPDMVFLANIHPALQAKVLDQVTHTNFVACDTMNLWINTAREELLRLLPRVNLLFLNDEEAKMLSGKHNILAAARAIMDLGVESVVVKRGEHGATLVTREAVFLAHAYPLENVVDPTGAGDCFAGAFMGALARHGRVDSPALKRAAVYGSVVASFNVESFSLDRLRGLKMAEIEERYLALRELMTF